MKINNIKNKVLPVLLASALVGCSIYSKHMSYADFKEELVYGNNTILSRDMLHTSSDTSLAMQVLQGTPTIHEVAQDTDKPNALVTLPDIEHDLAFYRNYSMANFLSSLQKDYDLTVHTVATDEQLKNVLKASSRIDALIIAGHGSTSSIELSKNDLLDTAYKHVDAQRTRLYALLHERYASLDSMPLLDWQKLHKDIPDLVDSVRAYDRKISLLSQLYNFQNIDASDTHLPELLHASLTDDAQVLLLSCLTAKDSTSLAYTFASWLKPTQKLYAANESFKVADLELRSTLPLEPVISKNDTVRTVALQGTYLSCPK
jgi:hypothetical protein